MGVWPLPGMVTFTSHYHMAVAVTAMGRQFQGTPEFVDVFGGGTIRAEEFVALFIALPKRIACVLLVL